MNTQELKAEIVRHSDTATILADFIGISVPAFSNKINGNAEFKQTEILKIKERYNLSPERVVEIFFDSNVAENSH